MLHPNGLRNWLAALRQMQLSDRFTISNGNKMAQHLAGCGLSTCYSAGEEQQVDQEHPRVGQSLSEDGQPLEGAVIGGVGLVEPPNQTDLQQDYMQSDSVPDLSPQFILLFITFAFTIKGQ
ncbi:uncharacterized protein LOC124459721 [Drosophila willistoni]|uniref:uncharacterized protein LOC124459721 n=1 Tax=Drosophila willistoni TaxID=7260 RepID=UPI001F07A31A|nr:uncharacterized protein LOC124459721 [Drosophila willistoni]